MDLLLAGYGDSDDEEEVKKEASPTSTSTAANPPKPSSLFSKLPAPSSSPIFSKLPPPTASSSSAAAADPSKGKKRTVSLTLPIPKEALRAKYEDEFMRESGPALPEPPKPSGLSALLPAPKNPNPAKRPRMATPVSVRRHMEDKSSSSSATTTSSSSSTATSSQGSSSTAEEGEGASRQPARSLRQQQQQQQTEPAQPVAEYSGVAVAGSYKEAAAYEGAAGYAGYEAAAHYQQQQYYQHHPGYDQGGYEYAQQAPGHVPYSDLPEPTPEFAREWEQLTKGARIVDVNQAQITDKSGWSKEFIQENLAKASSSAAAKDRPGGVQRRKHQITSLAFEAKQREMELLNQRANARKTKSETWGKYGW